ncbi:AraC family transcriptional regulator [Paenibacillus caui]|uniref:AraC family transcriptional regulator n=1 Tax=Paenibacillus caui TaxID=2873927 RepID=UPI001CA99B1A|nr:AraC family transcriptional regulator [Paenibacillus caui]
MNNMLTIQNVIDYIEEHLAEELTLANLAKRAHYSEYHFHRLFQYFTGNTVMSYIRNRRLSAAAVLISGTDRKVLDIALECGFRNHETFSRSFRKAFGIMPSELRKNVALPLLTTKINLAAALYEGSQSCDWRDEKMNYKLVTLPKIRMIGYRLDTTTDNGRNREEIPAFWQHYIKNRLWENVPGKLRPDVELGVCTTTAEDGTFGYIIGFEVNASAPVPDGLVEYHIPETEYAVFTTPGASEEQFPSSIQRTWDYIFSEWFPGSGYEHAEASEIEWYDERCMNDDNKRMDIYVPVRRSGSTVQ